MESDAEGCATFTMSHAGALMLFRQWTDSELTLTKVVVTTEGGDTVELNVAAKYLKNFVAGSAYRIVCEYSENFECVDLGLSTGTLWSNMNLGAKASYEYGDFYGWGELEVKAGYYYASNYRFYLPTGESTDCSKYFKDGRLELEDEDDVATVKLGSDYRMPYVSEWKALKEECVWDEVVVNDYAVFKVTGPNKKFIYIPKNGYKFSNGGDEGVHNRGDNGYYWCRDKKFDANPGTAGYANPSTKTIINIGENNRYKGLGIRAVKRSK